MTMTRIHRTCSLALLLAGCKAYPVVPEMEETDASSSSSDGDAPPGAIPTSTDGDGASEPGTSGEGSSQASTSADASTGPTGTCGDGVQDPGEGCDAGADNGPYAACTDLCQHNVCGDGRVLAGVEGCDEGPANVDDGYCRSDCQLGVCGDGFVFAPVEACDAGEANGPVYGQCDEQCSINRCGDGELDEGFEECDAGEYNGTKRGGEVGLAGCDLDCGFAGRRIFLSSQKFTGDMGTRAGADLACQTMANEAAFPRWDRFRALLADSDGGPNDFVLPDPEGRPFILPTGLILAADYPALLQSGPGAGVTTTELGETLYKQQVWTNLDPFGDAYLVDPASTCAEWSSAADAKSARGGYNAIPPGDAAALAEWKSKKQWFSYANLNCVKSYRIYCIEAS